MGRILAIDYGKKRTGLAITDESNIIASGLSTISTQGIWPELTKIISEKNVSDIVIGEPKHLDNTPAQWAMEANKFAKACKRKFPSVQIHRMDERFTSKMAFQTMIDSGLKQKKRRDKALIDEISATIILQSFLETRNS